MAKGGGYRAPSVGRALKILELVAESQGGLGISELARRLEISKGTVFGLCSQLEAGGALIRDGASKRYGLGPLVATLADRGFVQARLRQVCGPELSQLRDTLRQSVFLGVMGRDEITVVQARQPAGVMGIAAGPGTKLPLTTGAVGRVFLAGLSPEALERVLARGLPRHTPRTITDPDEYRRRLEKVRRLGYAVESDEYLTGVWGVATALGAGAGLPAAIWAVGFTSALGGRDLESIAAALLKARDRIDRALA